MHWLSNTHVKDVRKIKRTWPSLIESSPQASGPYSVEDLAAQGIVGLYQADPPKPAVEAAEAAE
jgi:hypothetical protein